MARNMTQQPKKPTPQVPAPWSPHGNPEHPRAKLAAIGGRTHGAEWLIRPATDAFRDAIEAGRLSDYDPALTSYAGHWMYMYTDAAGADQFKNSQTRQYLPAQEATQ